MTEQERPEIPADTDGSKEQSEEHGPETPPGKQRPRQEPLDEQNERPLPDGTWHARL
jgi:hypothetical protein